MPNKYREEFLSQLATPIIGERLFAQVPDILFCIKNRDHRYIAANRAFADRLNLKSVNDIIGKTAYDLFPMHLADIYRDQDNIVYETGNDIIDRVELVTNSKGGIGWYLASKFPLEGKDGNIIGIASISRDLQTPCDEDLKFAGLFRTVEYIHKHYSDDLKIAEMAAKINLSVTQLDRRMRKVFKLTTSQFIRKTRLEAAARLLTTSKKPIAQVAQECGYSDQSAFTRQFHATVGLAPGAYRTSSSSASTSKIKK
ncbi:HTH-type transcriptional activator RhaS [Rubritalea halochordaticola]|uniref:HTH-type transcriptional activator RhaS n=1 Tax=Rubritalea halochordaticola TaxID=714537 RepID=A0ABP9UUN9_9BACT